jgi:hypothetical protein
MRSVTAHAIAFATGPASPTPMQFAVQADDGSGHLSLSEIARDPVARETRANVLRFAEWAHSHLGYMGWQPQSSFHFFP